MKEYQSIIINLLDYNEQSNYDSIDIICRNLSRVFDKKLCDNGTFWIFCDSFKSKNSFKPNFFTIANNFNSYYLKNIILNVDFEKRNNDGFIFNNQASHLLFFSKNEKYFFNKDSIREKHIWKDVEWGKRKKNYNPLGKSPGNVWIKTEDDGRGVITKHIPLTINDSIERILLSSSNENDNVLLINFKNEIKNKHNRIINYEEV